MCELDMDNFVTLTNDNGDQCDFLLLDVIEYEDADYMVLYPLVDEDNEDEDEESLLYLHVKKTDEGEEYSTIEDETVLAGVIQAYKDFLIQQTNKGPAIFSSEE